MWIRTSVRLDFGSKTFQGGAPRGSPQRIRRCWIFHWSPDSKGLIYGASDQLGFNSPYDSSIYAISADGGDPKVVVHRPGTNRAPQYSPDGKLIAFISSGGRAGMINALDLYRCRRRRERYTARIDHEAGDVGQRVCMDAGQPLDCSDTRRTNERFRRAHVRAGDLPRYGSTAIDWSW